MEKLIQAINKLQDVFNTVGDREILQLPQIVVVGAQSSGKSSVLENLVGRDFLPRGTGIVTRVPLVMHLNHVPPLNERIGGRVPSVPHAPNADEWASFLHAPDKIFTDFEEVRREINVQTDRLVGTNKNVSSQRIHLKIYSPFVCNLTLVDLPGLTKVAVQGQPSDIDEQIRALVMEYIKNPNSIILAVSNANVDIANSDSLKIAKEVDPDGNRTIGVLTKLDLMDKGTNAYDLLTGKVIKVKLGLIGVVNRSQFDIDHNTSIRAALKAEQEFFKVNYPTIAHKCGTQFLATALQRLLMDHIRKCLPDLRQRIKALQDATSRDLRRYGAALVDDADKGRLLLEMLMKFSQAFCASINGTEQLESTRDLSGGAMICEIFHNRFGRILETTDPLEGLSNEDIHRAIRNSTGTRMTLFVPDISFEVLVKRQISQLVYPAMRCMELVAEELERLMHMSASKEFERFRVLREKVVEVVSDLLQSRIPATSEMIKDLIDIQLAYINTNHPDFERGSEAVAAMLLNLIRTTQQHQRPATPTAGSLGGSDFGPVSSASSATTSTANLATGASTPSVTTPPATLASTQHPAASSQGNPSSGSSATDDRPFTPDPTPKLVETDSENGLLQWLGFGKGRVRKPEAPLTSASASSSQSNLITSASSLSAGPQLSLGTANRLSAFADARQTSAGLHASHHLGSSHSEGHLALPSHEARQEMEVNMVKALINSYFAIVVKNVQDAVPKTIMHFLINYVMAHLQTELVTKLYSKDSWDSYLQEDANIASQRKAALEMSAALNRASMILSEVQESPFESRD